MSRSGDLPMNKIYPREWPLRWSHTTLELYRCPEALALKLNGEAAVRPANVYSGSDLHEAIARLAQAAWEKGTTKHDEAAAQIALGYEEPVRSNFIAFAKSARFPWPIVRGGRDDTCPVEQMWECDLPNGAGKFIGRVDLAFVNKGANKDNPFADSEDCVSIVDWKQGRPKTWWADEAPKQLTRYAWMYNQTHADAKDFDVFYGAPNWSGAWAFRKWHLSAEDIKGVGNELASLVERIKQTERFEPRPSEENCTRCFYRHCCSLASSSFLQSLDLTPEDHGNLAVGYKAIAKAHEDLVYQSIEDTGREVVMGAKRYGMSEPEAGYEVVNLPLLVDVLTDANDALATKGSKLPAVRRVLKLDADNAKALIGKLLTMPQYEARAAAAVKEKPAGKPRLGFYLLRNPEVPDDDPDDNSDEENDLTSEDL